MEGKLIDGLLSVMVEYLSRHTVYQAGIKVGKELMQSCVFFEKNY